MTINYKFVSDTDLKTKMEAATKKAQAALGKDDQDEARRHSDVVVDIAYEQKRRRTTGPQHDPLKGLFDGFGGDDDDDAGYDPEAVKEGLTRALRSKQSFGFNMGQPQAKAAILGNPLSGPATGPLTSDQPLGAAAVALRDLFETEKVNSGNVRYYTIGAGAATVVAEGGEKLDGGIDVTPVDAALVKIATLFTFSDELKSDAGFLVAHIQREASRAVLLKENEHIVSAFDNATSPLTVNGALEDAVDVFAEAIGKAQDANGITPSRIVVNPTDLAAIRSAKASTSGRYHFDPLAAAPTAVHGVELTATSAVTAGNAYAVSPGVGVFYTHVEGLRIETGYASDDWIYNLATTRVEERILAAVIRPSLLTQITLTGGE